MLLVRRDWIDFFVKGNKEDEHRRQTAHTHAHTPVEGTLAVGSRGRREKGRKADEYGLREA